MRLYKDDAQEAESIIGWLERRLENCSVEQFNPYIRKFEEMWKESFGTLDNVPEQFKSKVKQMYIKRCASAKIGDRQ